MMRDLLTSGQFLAPAAVLAHGRPGCAVLFCSPAAEAIARQMLYTLVDAAMGSFSLSSGGAVWVRERELQRAEGTVLQ